MTATDCDLSHESYRNSRPVMDEPGRKKYRGVEITGSGPENSSPKMFQAVVPPQYEVVSPTCIRNPADGQCFTSVQAAWEGFLDKPVTHLPPGYVQVPSVSRPGQVSYFNKHTGEKYSTLDLAWSSYSRKHAAMHRLGGIPEATNAKDAPHTSRPKSSPKLAAVEERSKPALSPKQGESSVDQHYPVATLMKARNFVDREFGANEKSIGKCHEEDANSRLTMSLQDKRSIRWIRLPEIIGQLPDPTNASKNNTDVVLFGKIDINHLIQGVVGDCWLLAALACLAEFPDQIKALFEQDKASADGKYTIRIYDLSRTQWESVVIDDFIPCTKSNGRFVPIFARPYGNEMWAVLLEKAMAKFIGSYAGISGGHEAYALIALTGFPQVYQFRREANANSNQKDAPKDKREPLLLAVKDKWIRGWSQYNKREEPSCGFRPSLDNTVYSNSVLFEKLVEYDSRDYLLAASITSFRPPNQQTEFYRTDGLVLGHAYSLISVVEVSLEDKKVRLVELRNPHGSGRLAEWKGDWSDHSPLWDAYPAVASELGHVKSDDGVFWMPYETFADCFDRILVLCKPMGLQRDVARASARCEAQLRKAEAGRATLGIAMKKLASSNTLDAIKRMSVQSYDPYLNVPDWIRSDQVLLRQWINDKGHHL